MCGGGGGFGGRDYQKMERVCWHVKMSARVGWLQGHLVIAAWQVCQPGPCQVVESNVPAVEWHREKVVAVVGDRYPDKRWMREGGREGG